MSLLLFPNPNADNSHEVVYKEEDYSHRHTHPKIPSHSFGVPWNDHRKGEKERRWLQVTFWWAWTLQLTTLAAWKEDKRDLPGGPVVKTLHSWCRGHGFHPDWGTKSPPFFFFKEPYFYIGMHCWGNACSKQGEGKGTDAQISLMWPRASLLSLDFII